MARTWIWTPVKCSVADGTLSVRSANEISIDFPAHYCNWMVIAPMRATFNVAVESLDLVRGQIGGYWNYAEVGAGNGKGSGYLLLKFPKGMPEGKNWIGGKTAAPLPIAHLPRTEP